MIANWANFWSGVANMNIATVATFPDRHAVALKDHAFLDIFDEFKIALFVMSFDFADFFE